MYLRLYKNASIDLVTECCSKYGESLQTQEQIFIPGNFC